MEASATTSRIKSSLLMAAAFYILVYILSVVVALVPMVGNLFYAALLFASPFVWLLLMVKGPLANPTLMGIAIIAPYPLLGLLVGYRWPIGARTKSRALGQILVRFGIIILVLGGIGLCLALFGAAHDS